MGSSPVKQVNALTKRWLAVQGHGSTVLSGLGVWPLLAFVADAASEPGRAELQEALGVSADEAAAAARELLEVVATMPAVRVALGLWSDAKLPLHQAWLDKLPLETNQRLSGDSDADQKRLDAWASDHTDGLIPQFPVTIDRDTLLLLASALLVQTTWIQEFHDGMTEPRSGPWSGGTGIRALHRTTAILDRVCVASTPTGPVTALTVMGSDDIDVHLVLGEERLSPAEVLSVGVDVIGRAFPTLTGDKLPEGAPGPGVTVERDTAYSREDQLSVTTVPFSIAADHDLVEIGRVFGLSSVTQDGDHFPGMSPQRLKVQQAEQNAIALFTATGFKAAAVTAFSFVAGAAFMPRPSYRIKRVSVNFDRPFAFYAVHRRTGLILAAGWVAEPSADPDAEPHDHE